MGGCAGGQQAEEEIDDSMRAEWSELYDRRVLDSLLRADESRPGEGAITHTVGGNALFEHDVLSPRRRTDDDKQLSQTIFFFDWDDTLFPSTWARKASGMSGVYRSALAAKGEHEERLKEMSSMVMSLLSDARRVGKVVILTSAPRSWVSACCKKLMPEAQAMLEKIPFIYALELMNVCDKACFPAKVLQTESKARAMRAILSTFNRSNSEVRGWINVVSIGDSDCERVAAREFARSKLHGNAVSKRCFTKTIKMMGRPSLTHMLLQLSAISKWFSEIVHTDTHVNIDLGKSL